MEPAICATSRLCVRRERKWSPSVVMKTCVLWVSRRKAEEWTIRSRSRWNGVRVADEASAIRRPRDRDGSVANGARSRGDGRTFCKGQDSRLGPGSESASGGVATIIPI